MVPRPSAAVCLRCSVLEGEKPLVFSDAALANFCFPLGPDVQERKQYMAPEVSTWAPWQQGEGDRPLHAGGAHCLACAAL